MKLGVNQIVVLYYAVGLLLTGWWLWLGWGVSGVLALVRYPRGQETGRNPADRGKLGSQQHIVVERQGIPSGANRYDSIMFEPLLDALPALAGKRGLPRCPPDKLHADKGYDF